MNRIVSLIFFIILVAVLWWALTTVLTVLGVPATFVTIAEVIFVLLAVFAAFDYVNSGNWFFTRIPKV